MNRLIIVSVVLLQTACVSERESPTPQLPPSTSASAPKGWAYSEFSAGGISVHILRFQCGSGSYGDEDTQLPKPPPGMVHCSVGFGLSNDRTGSVRLDPYAQYLVVEDRRVGTWREGMDEIVLDDPGNAYTEPIPTGGGALESVLFRLDDGPPSELVVTAGPTEISVPLECRSWSEFGGGCAPEGGARSLREADPGIFYPHSVGLYPQGVQPTCFDRRDWRFIRAPSRSERSRWVGQGRMQLVSHTRAEYRDNSGVVVRFRPSSLNRDPKACG